MFSWWTTHPVAQKSIAKVPNQKVARWPNCFSFFFFIIFFFFFRRASSNLCDSFAMVFAQNSTEQCTSSSLFYGFEVSRGGSNRSLKNSPPPSFFSFFSFSFFFRQASLCLCDSFTEELRLPLWHYFFFMCTMRTNHLPTKCNYYAGLLKKYNWCTGSVWREPGLVNDSSANTDTSTKEACEDRLACICCLKKWHEQELNILKM